MAAGLNQLPEPVGGRADILMIAGEHSGDQHAALVARELREARPDWQLCALGGPALAAEGVQVLHDLTKDSVVGFVEVLRHYGQFKQLFESLLSWVETHQPKAVVLVDYPGFNLRFAEALMERGCSRKGGGEILVYQYVSPQIWAWKAKRRFKMARYLDELGVIFPFELDCYADTDLPVHFVGHPFAREDHVNPLSYDPEGPILLLPGSRQQAVGRIFPIMVEAVRRFSEKHGPQPSVCLYPEEGVRLILQQVLERASATDLVQIKPVSEGAAAAAALTSSGTMSLNCALAGIPGAIVYRAHPFTAWLGQRLIQVDWLGIANLVLNRQLYPEFVQSKADPGVLASELAAGLSDPSKRTKHLEGAEELMQVLKGAPSESVARRLLKLIPG